MRATIAHRHHQPYDQGRDVCPKRPRGKTLHAFAVTISPRSHGPLGQRSLPVDWQFIISRPDLILPAITTHLPADPKEFVAGFGLTQPGARAAFKVYVVLDTCNEAGSATMVVQRPV